VLLVGADGVMVPFRPTPGTPKGRTVWRKIKVGVPARLDVRFNAAGDRVCRLVYRRLVAVLGSVDDLGPLLALEALRVRIGDAERVVWISDGARGLWRVYRERFPGAVGVLDFYHAAQNLRQAGEAWFGCRASTEQWFPEARHALRHGKIHQLIASLRGAAQEGHRDSERNDIIARVAEYLADHRRHVRYPFLYRIGLPLGSGFVESACKWLIQQRFKGVGMRWSEEGFNHLLLLRLAWTNDRFDALFQPASL